MAFERIKKKINGLAVRLQDWRTPDMSVLNFFTSFLFYLGLWPRTNDRRGFGAFYRKWLPRVILVMAIYSMFVGLPGIIIQCVNTGKVHPILQSVATYIAAILESVHLYCLMFQKDKLRAVLVEMKVLKEMGKRLPCQPVAILKLNMRFMDVLVFTSVMSELMIVSNATLLFPSLYLAREFSFDEWFPFDFYKSPAFEIIFLVNSLRLAYQVSMMVTVYSIIWGTFAETVGQYRILSYNIEKVRCSSKKSRGAARNTHISSEIVNLSGFVDEGLRPMHGQDPQKPRKKVKHRLTDQEAFKLCIKHHQSLIRFVHVLESTFEPILIMHIFCTLVPTGLAIALVINAEVISEKEVINIYLTIGCYMLLTAVYLICEEISKQDEGIRDAIYGCDWSGAPESFKSSMRIVMSYCNQPLVIQLAGFILMNNENFFATVKLTYSYTMTILTSFQ